MLFGNEHDTVVIREHEFTSLYGHFVELAAGERIVDGRERPLHSQGVRTVRK